MDIFLIIFGVLPLAVIVLGPILLLILAKRGTIKLSKSVQENLEAVAGWVIIIVVGTLIYTWLNPTISPEYKSKTDYYMAVCADTSKAIPPQKNASKIIVVVDSTGEVENGKNMGFHWDKIPNVAKKPSDVRYIGCLKEVDKYYGSYGSVGNTNCPALQKRLELRIVDLVKGTSRYHLFEGEIPPDTVKDCDDGVMYPDAQKIRDWISSVTQ